MSKTSTFIKLVIALISGEGSKTTALKIKRKAIVAIKAQLALKEARTTDLEDDIDQATEAVDIALANNGKLITDRTAYITNIMEANANLIDAKAALEAHHDSMAFLKSSLEKVES